MPAIALSPPPRPDNAAVPPLLISPLPPRAELPPSAFVLLAPLALLDVPPLPTPLAAGPALPLEQATRKSEMTGEILKKARREII
jgi:hypothetical protein